MEVENWQEIDQIFHSALKYPQAERGIFLEQACGSNEALRLEIESLLAAHEQAGSFFETAPARVAAEFLAEEKSKSMEGCTLGRYQITSLLGAGGMGEVYRAIDIRLDRGVAIKILPQHLAQDYKALERFEREAKAVAALSHPNILAIHDFGTEQDVSYAVMELLEGETLRSCLKRSRLSWRKSIEIAVSIAEGLAVAHAKGITHRDLKPENIFLTIDGQVKILDFGLARVKPSAQSAEASLQSTITQISSPGLVMGTLGYMSPEQIRGEEADAPSDIFSLGCVLYEMVTGQQIFVRQTTVETVAAILKDEMPPFADREKSIPAELERVVIHCLEKNSAERFQSSRDLAFALKNILGESRISPNPVKSVSKEYPVSVWIMTALAVLLLATLPFLPNHPTDEVTARPIQSLAVLPLENLSGNQDEDDFVSGMTDELISNLMNIGALRVVSHTSTMHYKGTNKPLSEIRNELKVYGVVKGSVLFSGEEVLMTAQLINGTTEQILWIRNYRESLRDISVLQSKVAQDIAQEIKIKLTPQEQARLSEAPPVNSEAYKLYLKGGIHLERRTEEDIRKAIEFFRQAIAADKSFPLPHVGLADSYILGESRLPPTEAMTIAKAEVTEALKLDNTIAEAYASLAVVKMLYDWDWAGAETDFRQAINLKPGYATAHHWYAEFLTAMGRHEEALTEIKQAQEIDPYSLIIGRDVGWHYYGAGRYDEAIDQCLDTLETDPDFIDARKLLGLAYAKKGMFDKAIAELQAVANRSPSGNDKAKLGYVYAVAGKKKKAHEILNTLRELPDRMYVSPYLVAAIYAGLNDKQQAFAWLRKAYGEHSDHLVYLKVDPVLESLRSDQRFHNLARDVGIPE